MAVAGAVEAGLRGVQGSEGGRELLGIGAGGDRTAVVDRVAEEVVVAECERLAAAGLRFHLRSEELGDRAFGAERPILLLDPVDGSLNAMQGLPYYSTSLALVDGEVLGDVVVGVVRNLATGTVFSAVRGQGALRDGGPLLPLPVRVERGRVPILMVEAVGSATLARILPAIVGTARRARLCGSAALSLCMVASGAASALISPEGMRAHDCAAALLILDELGATVTDLAGEPITSLPVQVDARIPVVASLDAQAHGLVLAAVVG